MDKIIEIKLKKLKTLKSSLGKDEEIISISTDILDFSESDLTALLMRGLSYNKLQKYELSIADLSHGLDISKKEKNLAMETNFLRGLYILYEKNNIYIDLFIQVIKEVVYLFARKNNYGRMWEECKKLVIIFEERDKFREIEIFFVGLLDLEFDIVNQQMIYEKLMHIHPDYVPTFDIMDYCVKGIKLNPKTDIAKNLSLILSSQGVHLNYNIWMKNEIITENSKQFNKNIEQINEVIELFIDIYGLQDSTQYLGEYLLINSAYFGIDKEFMKIIENIQDIPIKDEFIATIIKIYQETLNSTMNSTGEDIFQLKDPYSSDQLKSFETQLNLKAPYFILFDIQKIEDLLRRDNLVEALNIKHLAYKKYIKLCKILQISNKITEKKLAIYESYIQLKLGKIRMFEQNIKKYINEYPSEIIFEKLYYEYISGVQSLMYLKEHMIETERNYGATEWFAANNAWISYSLRQIEECKRILEEGISLYPGSVELQYLYGILIWNSGDKFGVFRERCLEIWDKLTSIKSKHRDKIKYCLALYYLIEEKNKSESLRLLEEVIIFAPNNTQAGELFYLLLLSENKPRAQEYLHKLIEFNPSHYFTFYQLGILYLNECKYIEAIDSLQNCVRLYEISQNKKEKQVLIDKLPEISSKERNIILLELNSNKDLESSYLDMHSSGSIQFILLLEAHYQNGNIITAYHFIHKAFLQYVNYVWPDINMTAPKYINNTLNLGHNPQQYSDLFNSIRKLTKFCDWEIDSRFIQVLGRLNDLSENKEIISNDLLIILEKLIPLEYQMNNLGGSIVFILIWFKIMILHNGLEKYDKARFLPVFLTCGTSALAIIHEKKKSNQASSRQIVIILIEILEQINSEEIFRANENLSMIRIRIECYLEAYKLLGELNYLECAANISNLHLQQAINEKNTDMIINMIKIFYLSWKKLLFPVDESNIKYFEAGKELAHYILKQEPGEGIHWFQAGLFEESHDISQKYNLKAIQLDKENTDIISGLIINYYELGNYDKVLILVEILKSKNPLHPTIIYINAFLHLKMAFADCENTEGQFTDEQRNILLKAESDIINYIEFNGANNEILKLAGIIYFHRGNYNLAEIYLNQFYISCPNYENKQEIILLLILSYSHEEKFELALKLIDDLENSENYRSYLNSQNVDFSELNISELIENIIQIIENNNPQQHLIPNIMKLNYKLIYEYLNLPNATCLNIITIEIIDKIILNYDKKYNPQIIALFLHMCFKIYLKNEKLEYCEELIKKISAFPVNEFEGISSKSITEIYYVELKRKKREVKEVFQYSKKILSEIDENQLHTKFQHKLPTKEAIFGPKYTINKAKSMLIKYPHEFTYNLELSEKLCNEFTVNSIIGSFNVIKNITNAQKQDLSKLSQERFNKLIKRIYLLNKYFYNSILLNTELVKFKEITEDAINEKSQIFIELFQIFIRSIPNEHEINSQINSIEEFGERIDEYLEKYITIEIYMENRERFEWLVENLCKILYLLFCFGYPKIGISLATRISDILNEIVDNNENIDLNSFNNILIYLSIWSGLVLFNKSANKDAIEIIREGYDISPNNENIIYLLSKLEKKKQNLPTQTTNSLLQLEKISYMLLSNDINTFSKNIYEIESSIQEMIKQTQAQIGIKQAYWNATLYYNYSLFAYKTYLFLSEEREGGAEEMEEWEAKEIDKKMKVYQNIARRYAKRALITYPEHGFHEQIRSIFGDFL